MIAALTGIVDQIAADSVILDVNGVGYLVFASSRTLGRLPARGTSMRLAIETHVREDHIHLYGFADEAERNWFRLLTTVQGVGARIALALLSALAPDDLAAAIVAQDKTPLTRADGVGAKLATRIVTELRDKAGAIALGPVASQGSTGAPNPVTADALSALVNLGYARVDAFTAVTHAAQKLGGKAAFDDIFKTSLKELAG
jgi:Holliday junction DNA helicase RuvA